MAVTTVTGERQQLRLTRRFSLGVIFVLAGLFIFGQAAADLTSATRTTLTLEAVSAGQSIEDVPHINVPTLTYLNVISLLFVIGGGVAVASNFAPQLQQFGTIALITCGIVIIPTILIAAAADNRTNITTMFAESLRLATPIGIGAMAGLWCERAGVVNVAIEGMMLFGACFGFTALFFLRQDAPDMADNLQLLISVLVAVLVGGLVALLHAWLSLTFKTDQIVSGTVINILAAGTTSFVRREFLLSTEAGSITLPNIKIPLLSEIPIIGNALFNNKPIFYLMFVIIGGSHLVLFHTRWGLRTQAVGEHPHAADTLGINVNRVRWINVFIAGMIAGLAGAWLSLEVTGRFNDNMTSGRGFIALAALIFGNWTPFGAFIGALLFGFADALGTRLQTLGVPIPVQFLQMVPYFVTIIVMAGLVGKTRPPKAVGKPYEKE